MRCNLSAAGMAAAVLSVLWLPAVQAQGVQRYTNPTEFRARVANPRSIDFEGLPGSSRFPFAAGRRLHVSNAATGITVNDVRFIGQTVGFGYETWLTTPGDSKGEYAMNGTANLMGGRHRLHIYLPRGVTAFGMDLGRSSTAGANRADIYVKLRGRTTSIQFSGVDLPTRPMFVGFATDDEIEHVDVFPNVQSGLIPYVIIDNLVYSGSNVGPLPATRTETAQVYATSDNAVGGAFGQSGRRHEVSRTVAISPGWGYVSHSVYISTANPNPPGEGRTELRAAAIPGPDGTARQVVIRARAEPREWGPRNWVGATLTVVMQEGVRVFVPQPADIACGTAPATPAGLPPLPTRRLELDVSGGGSLPTRVTAQKWLGSSFGQTESESSSSSQTDQTCVAMLERTLAKAGIPSQRHPTRWNTVVVPDGQDHRITASGSCVFSGRVYPPPR